MEKIIRVNPQLSSDDQKKAEKTIKLTNLNDENSDKVGKRNATCKFAKHWLKKLQEMDDEELREQTRDDILMIMKGSRGYWSIWMTVFRDDPDMLKRFIEAFPGTARECFDEEGRPLPTISRSKPVLNPALTQKPRYEIADVIPLEYETSILDWLERSGRLMERDNQDDDFISREAEIAELVENDSKYDDDDDEESL